MMKNDTVIIQQHQSIPTNSLVKSSMSRTLVHQTNKEFDKCAELLRNILSAQETRRNSKSSVIGEITRKNQQQPPQQQQQQQQQSQTNTRLKKQNIKPIVTKLSFIKTNINNNNNNNNNNTENVERRSSYSPTKSLLSSTGVGTNEDQSLLKNRLSPNKSRKHQTRSPSPTQIVHQRIISPTKNSPLINNKFRQKSPSSPVRRRRRIQDQQDLVRSSSCGDLPSASFIHKQQTRFIIDQFVTHLTRIRTISKQIRSRNTNITNDPECYHLWNELESSLSSALAYANDDIQLQLALEPLRNEILELRKQLQTTNIHLREFDNRRNDEQYAHMQKKFETNQIQCSQLLIHNQELRSKCDLLQEKLDNIERNNIRLIQRWTQQDLRSLAERTKWVATDNRFLLREENLLLKQKLYHVYDDFATVLNRNHSLEMSYGEQKQQLILYKQQFNDLKQAAKYLLLDLDKRSADDKIKRFLNNIILDQQFTGIPTSHNTFHQTHITPTKTNPSIVNSSSFFFETPHKASAPPPPSQPATTRTRVSPVAPANKLRPKSLFVTPTILNDTTALSKLQQNRSPTYDLISHTLSSSSTIYDAESILTSSSSSSSLQHQQRKRMTLYNSLPSLNVPQTIDMTITHDQQCFNDKNNNNNNNESGPELDQISDLTSKMFSSGEEDEVEEDEDVGLGISGTSTSSSSTISSEAE
ncbi:unnamed protein product [Adineta steineri]|uniref:Uncharacterized protein n=2 Tax=Adineta steineri TaxID=433720 RepID=A0A813R1R5_9BILA|nr:unnamed protein product [Adineta steineri]